MDPGWSIWTSAFSAPSRSPKGKDLQFRAESFNLTNTPHFNNPSASASDMTVNEDGTIKSPGNFMSISSARADQRTFRFGLRFGF